MGQMLVFTSAADGRDDEYNAWYSDVHLKEVCAVAPFTGAKRYRISDTQRDADQPHGYLAIYQFDGPAADALDALMAAASGFAMSDALSMDPAPRVVMVEDL